MRICVVGKYPPLQGGTSVQTLWLSYWLSRVGHDVAVVTIDPPDDPERAWFRPDEWERLAQRFPEMGRVRVVPLADEGVHGRSIPRTEAYVTRLASVVIDEVDGDGVDAIIASYLEPFGVAAMLAARSRGVPYVLIPAGSDLHRLGQLTSRRSAYAAVVRSAAAVITTRRAARDVLALGARADALIFDRPVLTPRALFADRASPLALEDVPPATAAARADTPVIGMYGKLGSSKGTAELLAAAARLRAEGLIFSLWFMTGVGGQASSEAIAAARRLGLEEIVSWIPFLPPWRVPEFLAGCDCVCFLENRFSVAVHRPQVPREIATAGRCLLLSAEVAGNDTTSAPLRDGENAILVEDPRDLDGLTSALRAAVTDSSLRERVGLGGRELYIWPTEEVCLRWIEHLVGICEDLAETHRGRRMSLESFQHTLLRIYGDPSYRSGLVADPAGVGDVVGLNDAERRSLRALVEEPEALERYCRSLLNKKFGHLERAFADALNAFPAVRDAARVRFHATWVLRDTDELVELNDFGKLLCDTGHAVLDPEPARRFAEWARFLGMRARARLRALADPAADPARGSLSRDALVSLAPGVELGYFNGRAVHDAWQQSGPWHVVAVGDPETGDARVLELSPALWSALDGLTEPVTGAELLARLVSERGADVEAAAAAALTRLMELGVLTSSSPDAARRRDDDPAAVHGGA